MKKILTISLVVLALVAVAVLPTLASVEDDMKAAVGTANSNAKFDVKINAPATYKAGSSISVVVTVENIKVSTGISLVEFEFKYDNSKLTLKNPSNDVDDALNCVTKKPDSSFENLSASKANGLITVGLCTMNTSPTAKNNGDFTFTFNFDVKSDADGDLGFYVKHSTVYGATMLNDAPYIDEYEGNGSYDVCTKAVENTSKPETSKPETSKPSTSNPETSKPETSKPATSNPETSDTEVEGDDESDVSVEDSEVVSDETVSDEGAAQSSTGADSSAESKKVVSDDGESNNDPNVVIPLIIAIIAVVIAATVIVVIIIRQRNIR